MFNATAFAALIALLFAAPPGPMLDDLPNTPDDIYVTPATDECGAARYQSLVGTKAAGMTLPADLNHRILGPEDPYTADNIPGRLNIFTDEDGIVTSVRCG